MGYPAYCTWRASSWNSIKSVTDYILTYLSPVPQYFACLGVTCAIVKNISIDV